MSSTNVRRPSTGSTHRPRLDPPGAPPPAGASPGAAEESKAAVLAALTQVSRSLSETLDLNAALQDVLEALERYHWIVRSVVTLLGPDGEDLLVEAGRGITARGKQARYRLGEGITGRVVESGEPIVVPRISQEPRFLNRTGARDPEVETTFICVPIALDGVPVGALAVDLRYREDRDYEYTLSLLQVVASMIAQAVKVNRLVQADRRRLLEENSHLREELRDRYDFSRIVGSSGPMRHVYTQIAQVAPSNATVLIRGESGTGKELVAHAIHYNSPRAGAPFVKVNCAALPATLIEAELFGYERGAFTGAHRRKVGLFEQADRGTLFLDEVGDLDPSLQVKLLRVLQEREIQRVGGETSIPVNVRLVAATHQDLEAAMTRGAYREDLYYRLNVFAIHIPPLRERKPDILLLADHFVQKYAAEYEKDIRRISTPAIDMLMSYHWPGNVRELENTVVRAVLVCEGGVIHPHHLPPTLQTPQSSGTTSTGSLVDLVGAFEKGLIEDALKTTRGNQAEAARLLNTTNRILGYRVLRYGIDCDRFRH